MAPRAEPRKIGVVALATAKMRPQRARPPYRLNAQADPRSTIPRSMSVSGTCSPMLAAANARGKPVKRRTTIRISQT